MGDNICHAVILLLVLVFLLLVKVDACVMLLEGSLTSHIQLYPANIRNFQMSAST